MRDGTDEYTKSSRLANKKNKEEKPDDETRFATHTTPVKRSET